MDGLGAAHRFPKNDIVVRAAVYADVLVWVAVMGWERSRG